jgi:xanthine/uracil permease
LSCWVVAPAYIYQSKHKELHPTKHFIQGSQHVLANSCGGILCPGTMVDFSPGINQLLHLAQ